MNISFQYIIAVSIGILAAIFIPFTDSFSATSNLISSFVLSAGKYFTLPLIICSLPIAVTRLRRAKKLGRVLLYSTLAMITASALLTLIGTSIAVLIKIERISVAPNQMPAIEVASLAAILRNVLLFDGVFTPGNQGATLLALAIPAFLLGWHYYHDKELAEPSYNFFDSLSRIFYRANYYFLYLMPFLLAILAFHVTYISKSIIDFDQFIPFLQFLMIACIVIILGIYPLLLWLCTGRRSPWHTYKALGSYFIASFVSASNMFNYGNLTVHLKEKLDISRDKVALIAPLYLMFSRGGTALVTAICMITTIRSYSSLEITVFQVAWTALFSFLISFGLPTVTNYSFVAALIVLGQIYGRGLENGWLILVPILPLIMMVCTLLDAATNALLLVITNKNIDIKD